jgi:hypothetical protein
MVSRVALEKFMRAKSIIPRKWMAARLGMDVASFEIVAGKLDDLGLRTPRYVPYDQFAAENLSEDIAQSLPSLRFQLVGDSNDFCLRLHKGLHDLLGISVTELFCKTSDELQEDSRQFANTFDCLTLEPLSTKHAVWLDFGKPLTLGPDRISKLFYAENREEILPVLAGSSEPRDLANYMTMVSNRGDVGQ